MTNENRSDETSTDLEGGADRRTDLIGGVLLICGALLALAVANSPWSSIYDRLLDVQFQVRLGEFGLEKPVLLWINDGLMAIFFLLVGVELKRELLEGELSSPARVVLPLGAAVGGVVVPVGIYLALNAGQGTRVEGWAIPAATDIAFAIGVLALLGDRVPIALRTFLLSLAVFDDLAAILIIAVAYTEKISWAAQGVAAAIVVVLIVLNRLRVTRYGVYLLLGLALWVSVLKSGVHATLAGVALGLTIPRRPTNLLGHAPLHQLEQVLRPWVAFVILPVFAFVNAGVSLRGLDASVLTHTVTLGVAGGLVLGKIVGVFGTTMLLNRIGLGSLADGTRPVHYLGIAALAGIGFTMSLFIGVLAFEDEPRSFDAPIRVGVLLASVVAGALGTAILARTLPRAGQSA